MSLDIRQYLAEEAETGTMTQEYIDWYKKEHKGREKWGKVSYSKTGSHPFGSSPFCKLCWKKFEIGDFVYKFYVGGHEICYHINCFDDAQESMQRNIIYQDRAARRRFSQRLKPRKPKIEWWE